MSTRRMMLRRAFALLLALAGGPVLAANYVFPGNLPAGCSGASGSYTCGPLNLGYNDTLTIGAPTPATIMVNGNLSTNNAQINAGGSAAHLSLVVTGTLSTGWLANVNANVTAGQVYDGAGLVNFGGSLATTSGPITLSFATSVTGHVSSTTGDISLAGFTQVGGNVSCSCNVTTGYAALVVGNVSAATMNSSLVQVGGSITTSGAVDLGYASSIGGGITASAGSITLGGASRVAQCLRSGNASTIRLNWSDDAHGGVCCGSLGSCTRSCVSNGSGSAMPALCSGSAPATPPGRFNAFETATAAGSVSGVIKTKVAGSTFGVAVVALNTAGTGLATSFSGNVKVEVLDASDGTGALDAGTGCHATWVVAAGTSATTLAFAASDQGRKNVSLTVAEAFRDLRLRISYPDSGTATVIGCSSDNFAVRPAGFASLAATDGDWGSAGTTRTLANGALAGGNVHKAGQPFSLRATAVNAAGVTTARYSGSPTAVLSACSGTACGGTPGTLTLGLTTAAGVASTAAARYSEAGAFELQLADSSFAAVDASDGSSLTERTIVSSPVTVGRFVPDHFDIVNLITPVLRTFDSSTCASRSFTYLGQPFGYATRPQAAVYARNAAGATTTNYAASRWSSALVGIVQTYAPAASATPGLDSSQATLPAITPGASGSAVLAAQATDRLTLVRPPATPVAPFNAALSLDWRVSDANEAAVPGNGTIVTTASPVPTYPAIAFDAGSEFRYGQLRLGSAYGSELVNLAMPLDVQYWNGSSFVTNAADHCTTLPATSVALANFRGGLAACDTATASPAVTFSGGRSVLRMLAPGNGHAGSSDATLQLGNAVTAGALACPTKGASATPATAAALPWLRVRLPGGSSFDQNPSARLSFGQRRAPLIHLREVY
ncbi:MAG: hypothetical protein KF891_04425 [Rhizobacter sp.]|nr:hypothetical protein [Rhizobacter sp.]